MSLPKQIEEAAKKAEELQKQLTNNDKPDETPPAETPPAEPPTEPPVGEPAPAATPSEPTPSSTDYEAQYHTLRGKYDAEVPALYDKIGQLSLQIVEITNKLNAATTAKPTESAPAPPKAVEYLNKEMPEVAEAMNYLVQQKVQELVEAKVGKELSTLSSKIEGQTINVMLEHLDKNVQNWRTINESPAFKQWLEQPDIFSGARKFDLLQDAFNRGEPTRVAAFFADFQKMQQPAAQPAAKPASAPMGKFQAPPQGTGSPVATQPPPEKPKITRSDITKFYNDVARGLYKNRPEEVKKLQVEIDAAVSEGRVV